MSKEDSVIIELMSREDDPMTVDRVCHVLAVSKRKVYRVVLAELQRLEKEYMDNKSNDEEE